MIYCSLNMASRRKGKVVFTEAARDARATSPLCTVEKRKV